jgi:GT2 family glycosyltransferase
MTLLSILIINWNGSRHIETCLVSIREKVTVPHEVIVFDNNSTDGSSAMIAEHFPQIKLIRSSENLGFAKGNNLAAHHARGQYLLLLNNDTILQSDIADAVNVLERDPRIGAVGAAMFGGDGMRRLSCAHFPSPARLWLFSSIWFDPARTQRPWPSSSNVLLYRSDYVEGSFLMTRTDAWRQLGGMDENNFMYGDDVEYCRSLIDLGLLTVHVPSVRYTHFGGYNHTRMGYLFGGFRRYHRRFSTRWVRLHAEFVLRVGLLLRIPWYWLRSIFRKDEESLNAFRHALEVNRNWRDTLIDRHRFGA